MSTSPMQSPQGRRFTYADYLTWPEDERWELIDGVPYAMTPAPGVTHQGFLFEIAAQLRNWLLDKPCRGFVAPVDVRLPERGESDSETDTVVQPDLLVVCDRAKIDKRGIRGAPDFILEIVSPSSAARDEIEKVALYERHGVREYWILRPTDRVITIRQLESGGRFHSPRFVEAKGSVPVTVLEGFAFDMDQAYAQVAGLLPDEI